jgi:DNA-binding CsgD family transcriptional regulator
MKHLFFFYWGFSLVTGFAVLLWLVIVMIRDRTITPLPYTLLVTNFTLLVFVNILASYHYTNIDSSFESLRGYFVVIAVIMSFTIGTAGWFILDLYETPHATGWSRALFLYAAAGATAHVLFFGDPWLMVFDASIPVLFLLVLFVVRKSEPVIPGIRPFLSVMKVILIMYTPFYVLFDLNFLVDLNLFAVYSGGQPLYFGVLPLFYMTWSIVFLFFELRTGFFSGQRRHKSESSQTAITWVSESFGLSNREREILHLVTDGKSRKEIADKLGIAEGTVKKHVQNIFEKTKCHSRLEVMALVIREVRQRPVEECG